MAMKPNLRSTVVGVFANRESARNAIRELKTAGFTESEIGLAGSAANEDNEGTLSADDADDTYAPEGAMTGVATGAGLGALWGLGILAGALPAIGPAIAGGTLAALLSSAAAGAATAGLAGALIGMGMSKEEAEYYQGELSAGRTIVTVHAGTRATEATQILQRFGGYDVSTRGSSSATIGTAAGSSVQQGAGEKTLQAHEEQLRVQKTPAEAGQVTVKKEVHTEHKTIDVPVMKEEVVISRHAPRSGEVMSGSINAGEEIRIPVKEEQVHVEKDVVAAEEVSIGKRQVRDTERVSADLRKEEIKVEGQGDVNIRDERGR